MTINEIFQEYAREYIERFGDLMPSEHRKVIDAIIHCRTQDCGTMIYQCEDCGQNHIVYRSCGNRHCPNCQHQKTHQWLTKQVDRQLPGHHFMITFTMPQQIRRFKGWPLASFTHRLLSARKGHVQNLQGQVPG